MLMHSVPGSAHYDWSKKWNQIKPKTKTLLNILQDSSFSNQRTFIVHIQSVFNLPGRGFRQLIKLTSSVPMTLNEVIVHVRQFIIVLACVDGCSLICRILRLGSLSTIFTPSQSMMWFSVVTWSVRADLLMVDINLFSAPCVFPIFCVVYVLSVFLQSCFFCLPNVLSTTVLAWYFVHQFALFL